MFEALFQRTDLSEVELTFISKDDCPLCDKAFDIIERVRRMYPFPLRVIKIEKGDEWYDRYWDKVPVGLVGDEMIFKYRVKADDLIEKLRARRPRKPGR